MEGLLKHKLLGPYLFDNSQPNRYEVVSHYGFDLHFCGD